MSNFAYNLESFIVGAIGAAIVIAVCSAIKAVLKKKLDKMNTPAVEGK